jgi:hypothetical protein
MVSLSRFSYLRKTSLVVAFPLLILTSNYAQSSDSFAFKPIHVLPKFPGGIGSLNSFIRKT